MLDEIIETFLAVLNTENIFSINNNFTLNRIVFILFVKEN